MKTFFALVALILLISCQAKLVCDSPNVLINGVCCLDADGDNVCGSAEKTQPAEVEVETSLSLQSICVEQVRDIQQRINFNIKNTGSEAFSGLFVYVTDKNGKVWENNEYTSKYLLAGRELVGFTDYFSYDVTTHKGGIEFVSFTIYPIIDSKPGKEVTVSAEDISPC